MNPVGLLADYATVAFDKMADAAARRTLPMVDRARKGMNQKALTDWIDATTAMFDLERDLRVAASDSPRNEFFRTRNLPHRVERLLMSANDPNSLVNIMRDAHSLEVLPEAKRLAQIAGLLEDAELDRQTRIDLTRQIEEIKNKTLLSETDRTSLEQLYSDLDKLGEQYQFPGGLTQDEIEFEALEIRDRLAPEQLKAADEWGERVTNWYNGLLDAQVEAGLVSADHAATLKGKRQHYMPMYRLDAIGEMMVPDKNGRFTVNDKAEGIAANDLMVARNRAGSERELADPIENMVRYAARTMQMIDANNVWTKLADLPKKYESIPGNTIRKVNPYLRVPDEDAIFTLLRDGKRETWAAPRELVDALSDASFRESDLITNMLAKSASMLRAGATALYLPFVVKNIARDLGTATFREGVWNPVTYGRALASIVGQDKSWDDFVHSGATMSGFSGTMRDFSGTRRQLEGGQVGLRRFFEGEDSFGTAQTPQDLKRQVLTVLGAPIETIRAITEVGENVPRKAIYDHYIKQGMAPEAAMMKARNVTVDFQKYGRQMKFWNRIVPFVNARTQGGMNTLETWSKDPVRAAARTIALGVMPQILVSMWNEANFPDVNAELSERDRSNNLTWILGRNRDPETGQFTQVIRIPKPEPVMGIMNVTRSFVEYLAGNRPVEWKKLGFYLADPIQPFNMFDNEGNISAEESLDSVIPPVVRTYSDLSTNTRSFYGGPIDSLRDLKASPHERYDERTPLPAVVAGRVTGKSPKRIQYAVESLGAGLGRQGLMLGDTAMRAVGMGEGDQVLPSGERFLKSFVDPFTRAYPVHESREDIKPLREEERLVADRTLQMSRVAERMMRRMRDMTPDEKMAALETEMAAMTPIQRETFETEMVRILKRQGARDAEAQGMSAWSRVKDLPDEDQPAEIERLILSGELSGDAAKVLYKAGKGQKFVSQGVRERNSRIGKEARARVVLNRIQELKQKHADDPEALDAILANEILYFEDSKILTAPVLQEIKRLMELGEVEIN